MFTIHNMKTVCIHVATVLKGCKYIGFRYIYSWKVLAYATHVSKLVHVHVRRYLVQPQS